VVEARLDRRGQRRGVLAAPRPDRQIAEDEQPI
jgi:hypothetical protein